VCDELSGAFIEAEGECVGQPALRAGRSSISPLSANGWRDLLCHLATHIYRAGVSYTTRFNVNGRRPETLYNLLEQAVERRPGVNWFGPVIGIVTNNKDPEDRGRVKIKFPWLSEDVESNWARVVGTGGRLAARLLLPARNQRRSAGHFRAGDINRPYVWAACGTARTLLPAGEPGAGQRKSSPAHLYYPRPGHKLTFTTRIVPGVVLQTAAGIA